MQRDEALEILSALIDGVNPFTGEEIPDNHLVSAPKILRAFVLIREELDNSAKRKDKVLPDEAGKPWFDDEDQKLISEYKSGLGSREIAKIHQRTNGAIVARVAKLHLENSKQNVRR